MDVVLCLIEILVYNIIKLLNYMGGQATLVQRSLKCCGKAINGVIKNTI